MMIKKVAIAIEIKEKTYLSAVNQVISYKKYYKRIRTNNDDLFLTIGQLFMWIGANNDQIWLPNS